MILFFYISIICKGRKSDLGLKIRGISLNLQLARNLRIRLLVSQLEA